MQMYMMLNMKYNENNKIGFYSIRFSVCLFVVIVVFVICLLYGVSVHTHKRNIPIDELTTLS